MHLGNSYKRVKRPDTAWETSCMHSHQKFAQQGSQRHPHSHAPQLQQRHRHYPLSHCPPTKPHHDMTTGRDKPASHRMPRSREVTSPLRWYISAFPLSTETDRSCIAQRTNAPLGIRPLSVEQCPLSNSQTAPLLAYAPARLHCKRHRRMKHDLAHPY